MTDAQQSPQSAIADSLGQLSDQTGVLVREEIHKAQQEMWEKATLAAPALGMLGAAAICGILTVASSYRLTLRVLERWMGPAAASVVAVGGYGSAAGWLAVTGAGVLKKAGPPVPTETAKDAARVVAGVAEDARG